MSVRLFSFFTGVGFLDLGFEVNGFAVEYVNEVHEPFIEAYHHARSCMQIPQPQYGEFLGSIEELAFGTKQRRLSELVEKSKRDATMVGFIGGPPCPDFSVGGKNRGRYGDNGKLSAIYAEVICQQHPDFFLFENVKGLWRTKKHRAFFEELKAKLHSEGYITTERLINAIEYGAPQDRDRIILFGFHRSLLSDMGLDMECVSNELPQGLFPWERHILATKGDLLSLPWPTTDPFIADSIIPCPDGIRPELTVEHWFRKNNVTTHPNAEHYFMPRAGKARFESIDEGDVSRKSFKRLHRWRYSPTVAYGNNEVHIHPYKPRRLSAAEAMALQSLPSGFQLPPSMSLSNMFKTIGNGVPFLAAKGLAETVSDFLGVAVSEADSSAPSTCDQPVA